MKVNCSGALPPRRPFMFLSIGSLTRLADLNMSPFQTFIIDRRLNLLSYVLRCYRVVVEIVLTHSRLPYFLSFSNPAIYLNATRRGETDTQIVIESLK